MAKKLSQLQEIDVTDCEKLEDFVSTEVEDQVQENERCEIEFTKLCTLTLQRLPQLTSFGFSLLPDVEFQEIHAEDEPDTYMPLFNQNVVLPNLKNLKLSSIKIECRWLNQLPMMSSCCRALTNLTLEECNGLKFLFSCSMVKSLVELKKVVIPNCKTIEGIINTEKLRGEQIKMEFPKLLILQLKGILELTLFSSGNSVVFHSLTRLSIENCPKLKTFLSDSTSVDIILSKDTEERNYLACMQPLFDKKFPLRK
ncbi:hypothetical protein Dsin_019170 [Dipteronia sinensis]|uniref:Disease resistance protein At4g27190-like leucine-rich repeats domain-containing protein n=1 Tax=Dipteronia sinensis TaxID=43782 RepID=A0AAE0E3T2_9ROSI|nr:hypothetical protein Dsin_019170 [Dipteronia sinensis]